MLTICGRNKDTHCKTRRAAIPRCCRGLRRQPGVCPLRQICVFVGFVNGLGFGPVCSAGTVERRVDDRRDQANPPLTEGAGLRYAVESGIAEGVWYRGMFRFFLSVRDFCLLPKKRLKWHQHEERGSEEKR